MPAVTYDEKTNWADDVDEDTGTLPESTVSIKNNLKVLTDYKYNDDNKRVKVVRTYKIEKRMVSKTIAERKNWAKFGDSVHDQPGPNPATTIIAEDVFMQFLSSKEEDNKEENSMDKLLEKIGDKIVKCRSCSGDHWTSKCPYKDTILGEAKSDDKKSTTNSSAGGADAAPTASSKYVPPSLRDGGNRRMDTLQMQRRDDTTAIRISNLSENTTEADLEELVKPFGYVQKCFLPKEKMTNACKGFAYVHFKSRNEAAKAIQFLNGFGYDHLILNVDWSKPKVQNN